MLYKYTYQLIFETLISAYYFGSRVEKFAEELDAVKARINNVRRSIKPSSLVMEVREFFIALLKIIQLNSIPILNLPLNISLQFPASTIFTIKQKRGVSKRDLRSVLFGTKGWRDKGESDRNLSRNYLH